jgi:hypothetical protein
MIDKHSAWTAADHSRSYAAAARMVNGRRSASGDADHDRALAERRPV